MSDRLHVVEICAGAGGQALGLHRAGFSHLAAIESDVDAARTLATNLARLDEGIPARQQVYVGDVTDAATWDPERFTGVDLLAGGPPCPPFSDAGRRLGSTDERDLYAWAIGLVDRIRPRSVMLENVQGLSRPRFAGYRQAVTDRLADIGYIAHWRLVDANDFGVPQARTRYILVAVDAADAAYFGWPEATPGTVTVGSALRTMMGSQGWEGAAAWAASADSIAPTIVGGSRKHGGADLGPTGTRKRWTVLGVNGASVAASPPDATFPVDGAPRLTPSMLARLQGFPTDPQGWTFTGSKTAQCRQIGNAFPPPVAEAVGRRIAAALRHEGVAHPHAEPEVHSLVFRALTRHDRRGVDHAALRELGLSDRQIDRAVTDLRRDFDILTVHDGDDRRLRLLGWRSTAHGHGTHLPLRTAHRSVAA